MKLRTRTGLALFSASAVIALAVTGFAVTGAQAATSNTTTGRQTPTISLADGKLQGVATGGADEYLGIPYAKPPVGALRWHEPEAPAPWSGVLDASKPGPDCPQATGGDSDGSLSENCLYLNVYSPAATKAKKLPVIVFLHGGGHVGGTPNIYDGRSFASDGNSLVVIPAFRVGLFGFFGTPGTASESEHGAQGNWGMLDQQQALRWVRDNIAQFGGDPGNVTIVGESAGGWSVCFQLASPSAQGLFHKAVIESSGCKGPDGAVDTATFAGSWGCNPSDMACLRAVSAASIVNSSSGFLFAHPVAGGADQPLTPLAAAAAGKLAKVPVIIGTNRDEWLGFQSGDYPLDPAVYEARVKAEFGDKADDVLQLYPAAEGPDPIFAAGWLRGDLMFSCPSVTTADAFQAAGNRVFFYEFADRTTPGWRSLGDPFPPSTLELGATHTTELQYLFGYQAAERPLDKAQQKLADQMVGRWTAFAATGNPSTNAKSVWKPFADKRQVLEIVPLADGGPTMKSGFEDAHHCGFWNAQ